MLSSHEAFAIPEPRQATSRRLADIRHPSSSSSASAQPILKGHPRASFTAAFAFVAAYIHREHLSRKGRCATRRALRDPESLRWSLELALRANDTEEAESLKKVIAETNLQRPTSTMQCLLRERVRQAVDVALDNSASRSKRFEAIETLQGLATPPLSSEEAENGLYFVLRSNDEELIDRAEAALWASWTLSGDEVTDSIMKHGVKLMGVGEFDKATQAFSEVIDALPNFAEGWNKRATAHFLAKRYDDSIEDCHRVLALKPKHFGCLSGLGICYLRKSEEQSALKWLKQALEVNPRNNDMQRIVDELEARFAATLLQRRLKQVMEELRGKRSPMPRSKPEKVHCSWDVFRIEDSKNFTYYFRIRVKCLGVGKVTGLGRYYALQQVDGSVIPLSRLTQGPTAFSLRPGQSYCYSFMLSLSEELTNVRAGLILAEEEDFFEASLDRLNLQDAPLLPEAEVDSINRGYQFMGRLELKFGD